MSREVETRWVWRRIFSFATCGLNSLGVSAVICRLNDPRALAGLGLALIGANVVVATLYLAGATVTDWARLARAARGGGES
ncbi:MAG: hypothetical protein CFE28_12615 [Alphaproteobacteria bacterium PA2]|nr:MAG: hypothetical protein CFE28_12615 [Alphaproteobacteria bacterium PA2]